MAYETFKVLIIDDDPNVMIAFGWLLRKYHYEIIEAADGEEGLNKAFREAPDVLLLDLMMPKMNGYEVCKHLREAPSTADMPIVVLTALKGIEARERAREMGADDYMNKDDSAEKIDGRIKMLLKQRILIHTRSWLAELPGGVIADRVLRVRLMEGRGLAVCYLDLDGLAAFNEIAGFSEGDRILWTVAQALVDTVQHETHGDLVGHYGADDFILITVPERAETLASSILESFNAAMREITGSASPGGGFPTLSISIVIVQGGELSPHERTGSPAQAFSVARPSVDVGQPPHPGQVVRLGQQLLREIKSDPTCSIRLARL
jgi:diguanylate cyclase (GGDEF)-like protein